MAETDTEVRKKNTEELKKLNKALRDAEKQRKSEKQSDPASFRTYLKEQTIGRIDLKKFLPREVQVALGVIGDIRSIFKAKALKKKLGNQSDDIIPDVTDETMTKDSETTTDSESISEVPNVEELLKSDESSDISESPESSKEISDMLDDSLETLLQEILKENDTQTYLLQFISDTLQEQLDQSKIEDLNLLEEKREEERKSKTPKLNEALKVTENAEEGGFLSGLMDFFSSAGGFASLLGVGGTVGGLLGGITAALAPIAAVLGVVALGGTIVALLYKLGQGMDDLKAVEEETKKVLEDQANLNKKRTENQQTLMQSEETREDYAFRVEQNREKIQERLEKRIESDKALNRESEMLVTDPKTGETKTVTPTEALKIFSEENVSSSLTQEERTEARTRALASEKGGVGSVNVLEGSFFGGGSNDEEIRNRYFEMTLSEEERKIYRSAKQKEQRNNRIRSAGGSARDAAGFRREKFTPEEKRILELSRNTERTARLASIYTAATNLYNNNLGVREKLSEMGVPLGEFDPTNEQHLQAINSVSKVTTLNNDTEGGYDYTSIYSPDIDVVSSSSGSQNISVDESMRELAPPPTDAKPSVTNNNRQGDNITTNNSTTIQTLPESPVDPYLRGTAMEVGFR